MPLAPVGERDDDWVVRLVNYSPPEALHRDVRNTTMEVLYHQFLQSTRE